MSDRDESLTLQMINHYEYVLSEALLMAGKWSAGRAVPLVEAGPPRSVRPWVRYRRGEGRFADAVVQKCSVGGVSVV